MYQPPPNSWQPGQFVSPPPPPTLRQRFHRLPRKTKFGLGCGTLLLLCSMCICSAVAASAGSQNTSTATALSSPITATSAPTHVSTAKPRQIPTAKPTAIAVQHTVPTPAPTKVPTPKPAPTQPPAPTPTPAPKGVNGNPWGYDFVPGNYIYSPPAAFCDYFTCVSTFWTKTNGYVAQCGNDEYTHSGGVRGACSRDGGVAQILYSH